MKSQILKTVFMTSCEPCVGPDLSGKAVLIVAPIALFLLYAEPGWSFKLDLNIRCICCVLASALGQDLSSQLVV